MKKVLIFMVGAAAILSACQKDNETPNPSAAVGKISIEPILTRATESDFEEGDRIGLTVLMPDGTVYADNEPLTYSGGVFSGDLDWYADPSGTAHLIAYYPYDESGAPESFTVAGDQSGNGYTVSKLIAASKPDVHPSSNAIVMTFINLLPEVTISTANQSESDISTVVFRGAIPKAEINLKELTVEVDRTAPAIDIIARPISGGDGGPTVGNTAYRAIMVPQTVALTIAVTTADNKTLSHEIASRNLATDVEFTVDVTVTPEKLIVFEESPGQFIYYDEIYRTVTLANGRTWMAEPLRYVPDGYTPSADPTAESHIWYPYRTVNPGGVTAITPSGVEALTDEASIRKFGYLYDMYAALGGVEITVDNCYDYEGVQGICPPGWHVPTRADFFALCGLSNKNALGETGNQVNADALFYDAGYTGGKMTLFNAAGWNYVMTGARQRNGYSAAPQYQSTQLWSGNTNDEALTALGAAYGDLALTYITSSTCYQPNYSTSEPTLLTNIQFFSQMTTFSSSYREGRINVSYASVLAGLQVRCVKN